MREAILVKELAQRHREDEEDMRKEFGKMSIDKDMNIKFPISPIFLLLIFSVSLCSKLLSLLPLLRISSTTRVT